MCSLTRIPDEHELDHILDSLDLRVGEGCFALQRLGDGPQIRWGLHTDQRFVVFEEISKILKK